MTSITNQVTIKVSNNIALVHNPESPVNAGITTDTTTTTNISCDIFTQTVNSRKLNLCTVLSNDFNRNVGTSFFSRFT